MDKLHFIRQLLEVYQLNGEINQIAFDWAVFDYFG